MKLKKYKLLKIKAKIHFFNKKKLIGMKLSFIFFFFSILLEYLCNYFLFF
jgi:hypothetical protein